MSGVPKIGSIDLNSHLMENRLQELIRVTSDLSFSGNVKIFRKSPYLTLKRGIILLAIKSILGNKYCMTSSDFSESFGLGMVALSMVYCKGKVKL